MLPFARLIMQGRGHALGLVFISLMVSPLFWPGSILAAAGLSLVWLRIGIRDGALLWLWALMPAIASATFLDSFMPLLVITGSSIASWVLRMTASWRYTLAGLTLSCLLAALGLEHFSGGLLDPYVTAFNELLQQMQQQLMQSEFRDILPQSVGATFVAGLYGAMLSVGTFASVVLARSWQSKLYNPGGFQQEFHRLRLGQVESIAAVLLLGLFFTLGTQYLTWAWIALFPLLVAGLALFHAWALQKKLAMHWYFMFYTVLVLWDPLKVILAGVALADSFIDFRSRFPKTNTEIDS